MESEQKRPRPQIVFNIFDTKYDIIPHIVEKVFNWSLSRDEEDESWDVLWTDNAVSPDRLSRMKQYQKINHFPGMYAISRKNYLAYNLNKLRKLFPEDYNFFPRTWVLPSDLGEIKSFLILNKSSYLIVKPEASCQGRGIFLTRRFEDIDNGGKFVVQEYINKPFLIDSLKFDLRIYVLVTGCCPLRIFVHKDGLARFATEKYSKPNLGNCYNMCMHLTNYAVNKANPNFIHNGDAKKDYLGHKRSLKAAFQYIEKLGVNVDGLWAKIEDMIVKTICSVQPILAHHYFSCQPDDYSNSMCFEILGFDVLLDSNLTPYILEVNHTPSFTTDSPLDLSIKKSVITDTLHLLNLHPNHRKLFHRKQKLEVLRRNLSGKIEKPTKEEKLQKREACQVQRDLWELKSLNGFKKIYPGQECEKYEKFIKAADEIWQEWTGTKNVKLEKKGKNEKIVLPLTKKKVKVEKCSDALKKLAMPKIVSSHGKNSHIVYKNIPKPVNKTLGNLSCINLYQRTIELPEKPKQQKRKISAGHELNNSKTEILQPPQQIEKKFKRISLKEILSLDSLELRAHRINSFSLLKSENMQY
jgi:tubulin polyglutamylase TTLL6/13